MRIKAVPFEDSETGCVRYEREASAADELDQRHEQRIGVRKRDGARRPPTDSGRVNRDGFTYPERWERVSSAADMFLRLRGSSPRGAHHEQPKSGGLVRYSGQCVRSAWIMATI